MISYASPVRATFRIFPIVEGRKKKQTTHAGTADSTLHEMHIATESAFVHEDLSDLLAEIRAKAVYAQWEKGEIETIPWEVIEQELKAKGLLDE